MKQDALLFFTDTWLTLIGLLIFFIFFVIMLVKVARTTKEYRNFMAKLPLEEKYHE